MGLFGKLRIRGVIKYLGLVDWYNSLSPEQQDKIKEHSGWGENLIGEEISSTSQTQKGFFWITASNAVRKDPALAILLAEKGFGMEGSLTDQHFLYNALIEAYQKEKDYANVKKYCRMELDEFIEIEKDLRKGMFRELPPCIRCRDVLFRIVLDKEKDYNQAKRLLDEFVAKKLLTPQEAAEERKTVRSKMLYSEAQDFMDKGDFKKVKVIFNEIIELDKSSAANIYKALANGLLAHGKEKEALDYFLKAITVDPLIGGVKNKIKKLSKKLGVEISLSEEEGVKILQEKEKNATEWWQKRDLADAYVKIQQYDHAWRLFNKALKLRIEQGMPCDTIYSHMAKMLYKQKKYRDSLLDFAFAYRELLQVGSDKPPKYISQGIDRCLKSLKRKDLSHLDIFQLIDKHKDPSELNEIIIATLQAKRTTDLRRNTTV